MDLSGKKLFLLDLDGTLYLDEELFPGAAEFLAGIRRRGGRYLFLTNNSSRDAQAYVEKLKRMGLPARRSDFLTSADVLTDYLRRRKDPEEVYYVLGTAALRRQLRQAGFTLAEKPTEKVTALLCGFDTELTFQKLEDACILLSRGVDFIATNPDWVCPTWYGFVPDCGSVCQMLRRATGRRPRFLGKPRPEIVRLAMSRAGCRAEETLLVGDRLYTDIACGAHAGVDTVLVLSGESSLEMAERSRMKPTAIYPDVAGLELALCALEREG